MIPTPHAAQPDSLPFLLVRPNAPTMKSDALDEDGETEQIPCSKSVPPHAPPAPVSTTEHELPSVIVDPCVLGVSHGSEAIEIQRATDVDGLLASETVDFVIPVDEQPTLEVDSGRLRAATAGRSRARTSGRGRGFAIAAVAALTAAGGTFAGLRVYHVAGFPLSAASHLVR